MKDDDYILNVTVRKDTNESIYLLNEDIRGVTYGLPELGIKHIYSPNIDKNAALNEILKKINEDLNILEQAKKEINRLLKNPHQQRLF